MSRPPEDLPSLQALVLGEFQHLLGELAPEGAELPALSPTVPDRQEHGDLSIPCHPLARVFRKAPQAIAGDLAAALESSPTLARGSSASTGGGAKRSLYTPSVPKRT